MLCFMARFHIPWCLAWTFETAKITSGLSIVQRVIKYKQWQKTDLDFEKIANNLKLSEEVQFQKKNSDFIKEFEEKNSAKQKQVP